MGGKKVSKSITLVNKDHSLAPLSPEALQDILHGIMYAIVSITGDNENFESYGKANPWHLEALKLITGSEERALAKLTNILQDDLGLHMDTFFDCSKIAAGGHFIDTQGFIAHNDSTIVLSYRCTTTKSDWLANFTTTKSAWEVEHDVKKGHSGRFSGITDSFKKGNKPFVHTGFYNNFLASVPSIIEHIKPLLEPDQFPRKLIIAGHSLGAGIATLATCYFLLEFPWKTLPHSLASVTLGSPRACDQSMIHAIDELDLDQLHNVALYRVVNGRDLITKLPPKILGFRHLGNEVHIAPVSDSGTDDTKRSLQDDDDDESIDTAQIAKDLNAGAFERAGGESFAEALARETYEEKVAKLNPRVQDHMPDSYLKPFLEACGLRNGSVRGDNSPVVALAASQAN